MKAYEPGYAHIDVKHQMQDGDKCRYVLVAIDRATFIAIKQQKNSGGSQSLLGGCAQGIGIQGAHHPDRGKESTNRLFGGSNRQPSGEHELDQRYHALGIEHRLTKPKTPQTNGMVERFNRCLSQVLCTHHFNSAEDLEKTLHRFYGCIAMTCRKTHWGIWPRCKRTKIRA